jgi:hypothetical protein
LFAALPAQVFLRGDDSQPCRESQVAAAVRGQLRAAQIFSAHTPVNIQTPIDILYEQVYL